MGPFEFVVVFLSFIYSLALGHLLFAASRMVRHRRVLKFSWPHGLWMVSALVLLLANWIATWDFRQMQEISLTLVLDGFVIAVLQYFICAVVSPDFAEGETHDMKVFHEREGRTYVTMFLALCLLSVISNFAAGAALGIQNWANSNWVVVATILPVLLALLVRARWAQVAAPLAFAILSASFLPIFYPVIR